MAVSFYGNGETTGGVADRQIETAKKETTGGVGVRANQDSIFTVDNDLKQDTVSFRGAEEEKKKPSALGIILGGTAAVALLIGGLGLAHKHDLVGKIKNEKVKNFFKHTDKITEPCHKACSWFKANCYDKIINFFNSKK